MERKSFNTAEKAIESSGEEWLEIGQYAHGMAEYIRQCATPSIISIQGEWGAGKTSLMNLINSELDDKYLCVEFDTWEYSQFKMEENIPYSFLSLLLSNIPDNDEENAKSPKESLKKLGLSFAAAVVSEKVGENIGDVIKNDVLKPYLDSRTEDIDKLKKNIRDAIDRVTNSEYKRIVVFVDNLDRLHPKTAVELLETMKVFLDCSNCVFVVAVDTDIIEDGIIQKYGLSKEKAEVFFEKLIQLSFSLPQKEYDYQTYFIKLMKQTKLLSLSEEDDSDTKMTVDDKKLAEAFSIASRRNPRAGKRLLNLFGLECLTLEKNNSSWKKLPEEKQIELRRILFALICLKYKYQPDYNLVVAKFRKKELLSEWLNGDNKNQISEDILRSEYGFSEKKIKNYLWERDSIDRIVDTIRVLSNHYNAKYDGESIEDYLVYKTQSYDKESGEHTIIAVKVRRAYERILNEYRNNIFLECFKKDADAPEWICEVETVLNDHLMKDGTQPEMDYLLSMMENDGSFDLSVIRFFERLNSFRFSMSYKYEINTVGDYLKKKISTYTKKAEDCRRAIREKTEHLDAYSKCEAANYIIRYFRSYLLPDNKDEYGFGAYVDELFTRINVDFIGKNNVINRNINIPFAVQLVERQKDENSSVDKECRDLSLCQRADVMSVFFESMVKPDDMGFESFLAFEKEIKTVPVMSTENIFHTGYIRKKLRDRAEMLIKEEMTVMDQICCDANRLGLLLEDEGVVRFRDDLSANRLWSSDRKPTRLTELIKKWESLQKYDDSTESEGEIWNEIEGQRKIFMMFLSICIAESLRSESVEDEPRLKYDKLREKYASWIGRQIFEAVDYIIENGLSPKDYIVMPKEILKELQDAVECKAGWEWADTLKEPPVAAEYHDQAIACIKDVLKMPEADSWEMINSTYAALITMVEYFDPMAYGEHWAPFYFVGYKKREDSGIWNYIKNYEMLTDMLEIFPTKKWEELTRLDESVFFEKPAVLIKDGSRFTLLRDELLEDIAAKGDETEAAMDNVWLSGMLELWRTADAAHIGCECTEHMIDAYGNLIYRYIPEMMEYLEDGSISDEIDEILNSSQKRFREEYLGVFSQLL